MTGFPGIALAFLILALGGVSAWNRALLRGRRSPRAIQLQASGATPAALAVLASGETIAVRAVGGIGVTGHWVALSALPITGSSMLVTSGMLGPAAFRMLRLWALWGRTPAGVPGRLPV